MITALVWVVVFTCNRSISPVILCIADELSCDACWYCKRRTGSCQNIKDHKPMFVRMMHPCMHGPFYVQKRHAPLTHLWSCICKPVSACTAQDLAGIICQPRTQQSIWFSIYKISDEGQAMAPNPCNSELTSAKFYFMTSLWEKNIVCE